MVLELNTNVHPARTRLYGDAVYALTTEQELKIECPTEILNEEVPVGKVWSVHITISIDETDA